MSAEEFVNELLSEALDMYSRADWASKFTFMLHSVLLTTAVKNIGMYFDNPIRMMMPCFKISSFRAASACRTFAGTMLSRILL